MGLFGLAAGLVAGCVAGRAAGFAEGRGAGLAAGRVAGLVEGRVPAEGRVRAPDGRDLGALENPPRLPPPPPRARPPPPPLASATSARGDNRITLSGDVPTETAKMSTPRKNCRISYALPECRRLLALARSSIRHRLPD